MYLSTVRWTNLIKMCCTNFVIKRHLWINRPQACCRKASRMRGLSRNAQAKNFYGHSNAHKTLLWICVCESHTYLRVLLRSMSLLLMMPSCWLNFMTICWISAIFFFLQPQFPFFFVSWHIPLPKYNKIIKNFIFTIPILSTNFFICDSDKCLIRVIILVLGQTPSGQLQMGSKQKYVCACVFIKLFTKCI